MDENRNEIPEKKSGSLTKKPVLYFSIIFVAVFTLLNIIYPVFKSVLINTNIWMITSTLKPYIEDRDPNREIRISRDDKQTNSIVTNVIFLDRVNQEGNIVSKNININIFNEVYVPFALLISLVLALPVNRKSLLKTLLLSFGIFYVFTSVKIITLVLDNYRFPEWQTVNLPFIIDKIVYFLAFLLDFTGFSISLTVIILIFTISALYNYKELKSKFMIGHFGN